MHAGIPHCCRPADRQPPVQAEGAVGGGEGAANQRRRRLALGKIVGRRGSYIPRKRRRPEPSWPPGFDWHEVRRSVAALATYDADRKERQRAKENRPLWRKVLSWIWYVKILFPVRLSYYVLEVLTLHITGRRPLFDLDKIIYICILLFHCDHVLSAAVGQEEYNLVRSETAGQFSVYDCEDPRTRYTKVDLTATQPCPDPQTDYAKEYTATVMVLQTDAKSLVDVYTCQAFYSRPSRGAGARPTTTTTGAPGSRSTSA